MKQSPFTLAITSLKPHAGRTTTALALAWAFGRAGRRVLVLDTNQYPVLLPAKTASGDGELWDNVLIGNPKDGKSQADDVDLVIMDAPPLTGKHAEILLQAADAVLVTVVPIAQNRRFLPGAKSVLSALDPSRVVGWFLTNISDENAFHQELASTLRGHLTEWNQLLSVPEQTGISGWNPLAREDLPAGPLCDAYLELATAVESVLPPPKASERTARTAPEKPARPSIRLPDVPVPPVQEAAPRPPTAAAAPPPQEPAAEPPPIATPASPAVAPPQEHPPQVALDDAKSSLAVPSGPEPRAALPTRPTTAPGADWRLIGGAPPRVAVSLLPLECGIELPEGMQSFPHPVPASAMRALLRFGLAHGHCPPSGTEEPTSVRLRPRQAPSLPASSQGPLHGACEALLKGDEDAALDALDKVSGSADAQYLAGLLRLAGGRPQQAAESLEASLENGSQLGSDLAQDGLAMLVDIAFAHGLTTHFGTNVRGARLGLALTHLALGDEENMLAELEKLVELEPDDLLLRALRAERILDHGSIMDLEELHKAQLVPEYDSPAHMLLAFYRAQTLHRLGLPDTASLALREIHGVIPDAWGSLRQAVDVECQAAVETLARIQRVRNDLVEGPTQKAA